MEILNAIQADHREMRAIIKRLSVTTKRGASSREKLFLRLHEQLEAHATAEEEILYARLREIKSARELVLRSLEEHHVARLLLAELDALAKDDESWGAKLQVLQESVEHHMKEEETEVFRAARKSLDRDELKTRGEDFLRRRKELLSERKSARAA
ncbi:MAG: hemerythrin domain-containing protein [Oligoflexia bacterium]|nr:hemerythrin domain-containing protein [Oligoflexia bacterium]